MSPSPLDVLEAIDTRRLRGYPSSSVAEIASELGAVNAEVAVRVAGLVRDGYVRVASRSGDERFALTDTGIGQLRAGSIEPR